MIVESTPASQRPSRGITKHTLLDNISFVALGGSGGKYVLELRKSLLEFHNSQAEKSVSRQTIQYWFPPKTEGQNKRTTSVSIPARQPALMFLYNYVTETTSYEKLSEERKLVYIEIGIFLRNNLRFPERKQETIPNENIKISVSDGQNNVFEIHKKFYDSKKKTNASNDGRTDKKIRLEERSKKSHEKIYEFLFFKWKEQKIHGDMMLYSGAYQLFRRYKPSRERSVAGGNDPSDVQEHSVICEIAYVDVQSMTCMLITAEHDIYYGIIAVNFKNTMSVLLQRESERGLHYRFVSVPLWKGRSLSGIFSGLMTKTGNTSERPLASELLIKSIPPLQKHRKLYGEMQKILFGPSLPQKLSEDSIALQYLTDIPEEELPKTHKSWRRVRQVKDFRIMSDLAAAEGWPLFREPLRTFDRRDLQDLSKKYTDFTIFMQNKEK